MISFRALRPPRARPLIRPLRSKLDRLTKQVATELMERVRRYPPVPDGSRYTRTEDLYYGWHLTPHSDADSVRWELSNEMPYASLVHGPGAWQWHVHRAHNWANIDSVIAGYRKNGRFQLRAQNVITELVVDSFGPE